MEQKTPLQEYEDTMEEVDQTTQKLMDLQRQVAALMLETESRRGEIAAMADETKKEMNTRADAIYRKLSRTAENKGDPAVSSRIFSFIRVCGSSLPGSACGIRPRIRHWPRA